MDWKHLKTIDGNLKINKNYYVDYNELRNMSNIIPSKKEGINVSSF